MSLADTSGARAMLLFVAFALACAPPGPEEPPTPVRIPTQAAADENESLAQLAALPYASWVATERASEQGVVQRRAGWTAPGLTLYNPRNLASARLIDSHGEVLHSWEIPGHSGWHHVEPLADGRLAALVKEEWIEMVSWDSRLLWRLHTPVHHDIATTDRGTLLVPVLGERTVTAPDGTTFPVLDERVLEMTLDGDELARHPLGELFDDHVTPYQLVAAREWAESEAVRVMRREKGRFPSNGPADLLHVNSLEVLDVDLPGIARRGDLLVSLRELDLVAIVDARFERVLWSWGPGELDRPHHPSLLPSGRILIFDNGTRRGHSRVLEIDPPSGEIVWSYPAPGQPPLFSWSRGGAQRLANGNTLITESNSGRVLEIDRRGATVWEFLCPEMRDVGEPPQRQRAAICRARRLEPADLRTFGIARLLRRTSRATR